VDSLDSFFLDLDLLFDPGLNLFQCLIVMFDFQRVSFSPLEGPALDDDLFRFDQGQPVALDLRGEMG
jgi:hypothetical protein